MSHGNLVKTIYITQRYITYTSYRGDVTKALLSLTLVFLWLWFQTKSVLIATAGIIEIVLSIPIAFFFYREVFQMKYFDGLNAMTLYIVAAIGADDIFVFMDTYKQSAYVFSACTDLKTRMNWVYRRASSAMLVTSLTTCAAFVATALSPLDGIKSFGIFSAMVIWVDYILVITWFPACVVLVHNACEWRPCCCCFHRCCEMWPCSRQCGQTSEKTSTRRVQDLGPEKEPEKRFLEKIISGPFCIGASKRFS